MGFMYPYDGDIKRCPIGLRRRSRLYTANSRISTISVLAYPWECRQQHNPESYAYLATNHTAAKDIQERRRILKPRMGRENHIHECIPFPNAQCSHEFRWWHKSQLPHDFQECLSSPVDFNRVSTRSRFSADKCVDFGQMIKTSRGPKSSARGLVSLLLLALR